MGDLLKIGVLASGTGSNFAAIADAIDSGRINARTSILVCNRPDARVLELAARHNVPAKLIDHRRFESREAFDAAVADALEAADVELVVMAGFDRLITAALLQRFPMRVVNIHPALLPAFKGTNAQRQAADYGVRVDGATVHLVDEHVDHGPIVVQAAVAIGQQDSGEEVQKRILEVEHRIYPFAISLFADRRLRVDGRRVLIDGCENPPGIDLINPPLPEGF